MARPTAAQVREWSNVDFSALGYGEDERLQVVVDRAADFVEWASGRVMDGTLEPRFQSMSEQAVQYKTETLAYQDQPDIVETAADFMLLTSFSAGRYTETRRSLTELKEAGMIDADPRVNAILWPLLTDDMRDQWMMWISGQNAPALTVMEFDWSHRLVSPLGVVGDSTAPYEEVPTAWETWPN